MVSILHEILVLRIFDELVDLDSLDLLFIRGGCIVKALALASGELFLERKLVSGLAILVVRVISVSYLMPLLVVLLHLFLEL